jgi:hypothetical protein
VAEQRQQRRILCTGRPGGQQLDDTRRLRVSTGEKPCGRPSKPSAVIVERAKQKGCDGFSSTKTADSRHLFDGGLAYVRRRVGEQLGNAAPRLRPIIEGDRDCRSDLDARVAPERLKDCRDSIDVQLTDSASSGRTDVVIGVGQASDCGLS